MTKELRFSIAGGLACMVLLLAFAPGCTKVPNGGIPIYLLVDSPSVSGGSFGSSSYRIPDVWAESGSQNLGAYETPVRIPILAQGDVPIVLSAGIYDNGVVNTRAEYPFYRPDTFTLHNAVPGHIYTRHPVYTYFANTQIGVDANFEQAVPFTDMTQVSGDADGNPQGHCGSIALAAGDTFITSIQSQGMVINTNGRQAYMEFQYKKTNVSDSLLFDVGIEYIDATGYAQDYTQITIPPADYWKKTYLNFSSLIGSYPGYTFKIYFIVYKNPGLADAVYIDNVKFLYFN